MSAHRYTDCQIQCDYPGCVASEFGGNLNLRNTRASGVRQTLEARGWAVNVFEPSIFNEQMSSGRRLDYCPAHKPVSERS